MKFIIKSDKETVIELNSSESNILTIPYGITRIEWLEKVEEKKSEEKLIDSLYVPKLTPDLKEMSLRELLDYYKDRNSRNILKKRYACMRAEDFIQEEEQIEVYPEILEIPRTVKSIKDIEYDLLTSISRIHFNGTLAEWCSMDKEFLEQVWDGQVGYDLVLQDENGNQYFADYLVIPPSVMEIKELCFAGCSNLKQVIIGSSVIEEAAFLNCPNLEKVSIIGKELEIVGYSDDLFYGFPFDYSDISVTISEEIIFYLLTENGIDSEIKGLLNMETWIEETGESLSEFIEQYEGISREDLKSKGIDTSLSLSEQFHKCVALEYDKELDYGYMEDMMREKEDVEEYQEEVGFSLIDPYDLWEKKGVLSFNDYEEFDEYRWR